MYMYMYGAVWQVADEIIISCYFCYVIMHCYSYTCTLLFVASGCNE